MILNEFDPFFMQLTIWMPKHGMLCGSARLVDCREWRGERT